MAINISYVDSNMSYLSVNHLGKKKAKWWEIEIKITHRSVLPSNFTKMAEISVPNQSHVINFL